MITLTDIERVYATDRVWMTRFVMKWQPKLQLSADDIVQSAFLIAIQSLDKFKGDAQLSTWIMGIAKNVAANEWRKTSGNERHATSAELTELETTLRVSDISYFGDIERVIGKLAKEHKSVLGCILASGYDEEAIAQQLQIPKGTVKSRTSRMRAFMIKNGISPPV